MGGAFQVADTLEYDFCFPDELQAMLWLYREFTMPSGCAYAEFRVRLYP
jgi:hypothetical protein